jgi:hypothetical protein
VDKHNNKLDFITISGDVFADADITKIEPTNDGYDIYLDASDSINCDNYVWELKV